MAENAPNTVKAKPICHGVWVSDTPMALKPMPWKKINIMRRRPHKSPQRPAGTEAKPNITKAPVV
jgi:hypothetical protein